VILLFFTIVAAADVTRFSPAGTFFLCFWIGNIAKPADDVFADAAQGCGGANCWPRMTW
jgi:hypothetical protein